MSYRYPTSGWADAEQSHRKFIDCADDARGECESCRGYGYFDDDGNASTDRRSRKCLDCDGTGASTAVPEPVHADQTVPYRAPAGAENLGKKWPGR